MKPANAKFRSFVSYGDGAPKDLSGVLDFARALEDVAHAVVQPWAVMPLANETRPPQPEEAEGAPRIAIGERAQVMRAWIGAHLPLPALARLYDPQAWGSWLVQFDSDGLGDVYADGRLVQARLFLHGVVDAGPAQRDQRPWVCYSLDTTIQNVALEMARCSLSGLGEANRLVRDVARSLRTAASLLLTDNPRVNRFLSGTVSVNRSSLAAGEREELIRALLAACAAVDVRAFVEEKRAPFLASLEEARARLAPLAAFAKCFTIFLLGVSHMDLAWKWRWPETVACMQGTLENQVAFMGKHRDFTFLESSPPVWIAMAQKDPALYEAIRTYGRKGQFEAAGGMWCEPDGQMLGAESWVRQLLHGQRAASEIVGHRSRAGHNTDAFGFTWALPKIYAQAGIEPFLTQKMRYNEFTIFEEVLFWWESDDNTRILGVHTYPDHYQEIDPDELAEAMRIFHLTSGVFSAAILFGIGNHGGGPLPDMFDRILELRELTVYPRVKLGGMHDYLDHVKQHEAEALARLPVIRDELFLECHHKTYTVQARVKAANRQAERELYHAEALAVMCGWPACDALRRAWEIALFNQFHDILPGTSFPMVYQDVFEDYAEAGVRTRRVQNEALQRLLGDGHDLYVLNTLAWKRPALLGIAVQDLPESDRAAAETASGTWQKTAEGDSFVAVLPEMPAFGIRSFRDLRAVRPGRLEHGSTWAANRFFRVEFDAARGLITSLKLPDGTELAGDGIGRLDLLEDKPEGFYQTWNMHLTGREDPARCDGFELLEHGPVRVRFRARLSFGRWEKKKDFMVPIMWNTPGVDYPTSFFTVDYAIYADLPWIACTLHADWWEDHTDLKVAADTRLAGARAFYAIPFGQIERPTRRETPWEKARYEVPALSWADITDGEHGLAILNTSRHGHDALGGRLRLTLLTSPYGGEKVHVPDPLADRGRHEIRYAFYPHAGGPDAGEVARQAMEYEYQCLMAQGGMPAVPLNRDLLAVDPRQVLVTAVKPAESGEGFVVRGYEPAGQTASLVVGGALSTRPVQAVNFLEEPTGEAPEHLEPHQVFSLHYS